MKIAALYDIHGNLPALEAVLADAAALGVRHIVVGGDAASGPMPGATLDRLRALPGPVTWIRGNADREAVAAHDGAPPTAGLPTELAREYAWVGRRITREQRDFLAGLAATASLRIDGVGTVCFCHGTPRSDEEIFTPRTPRPLLDALFGGHAGQTVVCGHTHVQFELGAGGARVVNAGSVGMPYADAPGAYWLLLSEDGPQLRHTAYDLEAAARAVRASGHPWADTFAADHILRVASAEEAIAFFEDTRVRRQSQPSPPAS